MASILTTNTMAQSEFSGNQISVGVVVKDIDKSLDFYLNVIGMKKVGEFEVAADFATQFRTFRRSSFPRGCAKAGGQSRCQPVETDEL